MIEIKNVTKNFDDFKAVNNITLHIREKETFGLVGTNGAGKSTLLRMIADIYKPEQGEIIIDGENIYDNPTMKSNFFFISDEQYYPKNANAKYLIQFYCSYYPGFNKKRCLSLLENFDLNPSKKIDGFSKGMKKQLFMILGICAGTKYLLCDETFDGLDPVIRQTVKSLIANDMMERGLTSVISSHNLRELEDICDCIGLLHKGGVLLSDELNSLKLNLHKVQFILKDNLTAEESASGIPDGVSVVYKEHHGRLITMTLEGNEATIHSWFQSMDIVFYEMIPLTLEEIFISKTREVGYNVKEIIF